MSKPHSHIAERTSKRRLTAAAPAACRHAKARGHTEWLADGRTKGGWADLDTESSPTPSTFISNTGVYIVTVDTSGSTATQ